MSQAGIISVADAGGSTTFVEDIGSAAPSGGILNIKGGLGITTSGSGNTVTITNTNTGMTWTTVTSGDNTILILKNTGYITGGSSQCIFLLPASSNPGDQFIITGFTSLFQLTQNAGQSILFGQQTTTSGASGSISSTSVGDHILVVAITSNSVWKIIDSIGNLTVV